jgi:alpha,alpha-trehalose phosphorylase
LLHEVTFAVSPYIASLAGTWIAAVAGFGGMRDHDGALGFAPRLPSTLTRLNVPAGLSWSQTARRCRARAGDLLTTRGSAPGDHSSRRDRHSRPKSSRSRFPSLPCARARFRANRPAEHRNGARR